VQLAPRRVGPDVARESREGVLLDPMRHGDRSPGSGQQHEQAPRPHTDARVPEHTPDNGIDAAEVKQQPRVGAHLTECGRERLEIETLEGSRHY
jgi:hypothetical protein